MELISLEQALIWANTHKYCQTYDGGECVIAIFEDGSKIIWKSEGNTEELLCPSIWFSHPTERSLETALLNELVREGEKLVSYGSIH